MGPGSAGAGEGPGQAHPAVGRLFGLPLVPRDGTRVVRRRSHRTAHELAVREHQGGSRRAARHRPHLPDRAADDHAEERRLAAHHVPHARGPAALLRRNLFPERAAPWNAGVHRHPEARRRVLQQPPGGAAPAEREVSCSAFDELVPPPVEGPADRSADPLRACREVLARRPSTATTAGSAALRNSRSRSSSNACCGTGTPPPPSRTPDLQALYMATLTLTRMGEGGMYDQIAGGFCRYSTDSHWMIPHFEKMLYDNAGLMPVYAEAADRRRGTCSTRSIAAETAEWIIRDMQSPGRRLLLELRCRLRRARRQVLRLGSRRGPKARSPRKSSRVFEPRYRPRSRAELRGQGVAPACVPLAGARLPAPRTWTPEHAGRVLNAARVKLLDLRDSRVSPGRDEKILTSWNAMAIRGHGDRGAPARSGMTSPSAASERARLHPQDAVERRAAAGDVQGWPRASQCVSRRLRLSRRRDPRAAAGALPRG